MTRLGKPAAATRAVVGLVYYTVVMAEQIFNLDDANELVPWLEERFSAMAPVRAQLVERQE